MLHKINQTVDNFWEDYSVIFPGLVKYDPPEILLSKRMTRVAGYCETDLNKITLSVPFLEQHWDNMLNVILPHEMAHGIDYILNGWYLRKRHHGKHWRDIMEKIGQNPNPYHSMELK